ncbi:Uncharacterised protein [Mycobacteroides abscessus subsp. abscessus]|nr:Uncharacterised protein [Mycobacteroides abscessus subsp. abscessus]
MRRGLLGDGLRRVLGRRPTEQILRGYRVRRGLLGDGLSRVLRRRIRCLLVRAAHG